MTADLMEWGREQIKNALSVQTRRRIAWSRLALREYTGRYRILPNLLVIGAQRCGTSSLYRYLGRHPQVTASLRKETRYFTRFLDKGENWYRAHFPLSAMSGRRTRIAFEATPDYLLDLNCAERVATTLGPCRIIVMVRDPVERAHSHYLHNRRLGLEPLAFDDALEKEESRLTAALDASRGNPDGLLPKEYLRFSYATRGRYAEQLEPWLVRFPSDEVLVIHSQDLFARPAMTFLQITEFLDISSWAPDDFKNYSYVSAAPQSREAREMSPSARERLVECFREPNLRFDEMLGRSFDWGC